MLATLHIIKDSEQSRNFLAYARNLPYVEVVDKKERCRLKPEVEAELLRPDSEKGLVVCENVEEMFRQLGI